MCRALKKEEDMSDVDHQCGNRALVQIPCISVRNESTGRWSRQVSPGRNACPLLENVVCLNKEEDTSDDENQGGNRALVRISCISNQENRHRQCGNQIPRSVVTSRGC